jgi:hypothetical protein
MGGAMPIPEVGSFPGALVIFEHPAVLYRYSPALEVYRMQDTRLNDFAIYLSFNTFAPVFNENFEKALESGMPVIAVPYTPVMAEVLQVCLHKYFSEVLDKWLCVSFFHSDDDTAKISLASGESPVEYKYTVLNGLLKYPYIKKIEIPFNTLLTYPSLYQLVESVV